MDEKSLDEEEDGIYIHWYVGHLNMMRLTILIERCFAFCFCVSRPLPASVSLLV